jgi:4-hydroxyphenylacetate 3-monooxygenase
MFYAGARFVTTGHSFRTYDWDGATGMVERFLASYDLGDELAQLQPAGDKTARQA